MAALTFSLIAVAFVVAWLTFRLERASARRREIAAAQAVLVAVRRGLVLGMPGLGEEYQGWGRLYFAKTVSGATALEAGSTARELVERGSSYQAYRVPVAPLERLAAAHGAGTLVSEETVLAANLALWRVGVFNHLVEKQTSFNVAHAAEIADGRTPSERRRAISLAAGGITTALHLDGIGRAADEGGWYPAAHRCSRSRHQAPRADALGPVVARVSGSVAPARRGPRRRRGVRRAHRSRRNAPARRDDGRRPRPCAPGGHTGRVDLVDKLIAAAHDDGRRVGARSLAVIASAHAESEQQPAHQEEHGDEYGDSVDDVRMQHVSQIVRRASGPSCPRKGDDRRPRRLTRVDGAALE